MEVLVEISDEKLNEVIIEDLECQMKYSDDESVVKSCEILISFYKNDRVGLQEQESCTTTSHQDIRETDSINDLSRPDYDSVNWQYNANVENSVLTEFGRF